jgi:hypothetical protein
VVYDTQNYRVFGPCPSSGILTIEHDISETVVCFCPQVRGEKMSTLLDLLDRVINLSQWIQFPKSRVLQFLECRKMNTAQNPNNSDDLENYTPSQNSQEREPEMSPSNLCSVSELMAQCRCGLMSHLSG